MELIKSNLYKSWPIWVSWKSNHGSFQRYPGEFGFRNPNTCCVSLSWAFHLTKLSCRRLLGFPATAAACVTSSFFLLRPRLFGINEIYLCGCLVGRKRSTYGHPVRTGEPSPLTDAGHAQDELKGFSMASQGVGVGRSGWLAGWLVGWVWPRIMI